MNHLPLDIKQTTINLFKTNSLCILFSDYCFWSSCKRKILRLLTINDLGDVLKFNKRRLSALSHGAIK